MPHISIQFYVTISTQQLHHTIRAIDRNHLESQKQELKSTFWPKQPKTLTGGSCVSGSQGRLVGLPFDYPSPRVLFSPCFVSCKTGPSFLLISSKTPHLSREPKILSSAALLTSSFEPRSAYYLFEGSLFCCSFFLPSELLLMRMLSFSGTTRGRNIEKKKWVKQSLMHCDVLVIDHYRESVLLHFSAGVQSFV